MDKHFTKTHLNPSFTLCIFLYTLSSLVLKLIYSGLF